MHKFTAYRAPAHLGNNFQLLLYCGLCSNAIDSLIVLSKVLVSVPNHGGDGDGQDHLQATQFVNWSEPKTLFGQEVIVRNKEVIHSMLIGARNR